MVFVADELPVELRRVIEFLNDQMSQATVIGIEVRQYVGQSGSRILVPQVVGQTEQARVQKAPGSLRPSIDVTWDDYQQRLPASSYQVARELFNRVERYVEQHGLPWSVVLHRWYVAFQRPGAYNVVGLSLSSARPVQLWIKLPGSIGDLQAHGQDVADPYPDLGAQWDSPNRQVWWAIPGLADLPDVAPALDLCRKYQPRSGAMPPLAELQRP
jgi:hypothetical protein